MTVQNNNILSGSKQGKVVMLGLILACGKIVYHIEVDMVWRYDYGSLRRTVFTIVKVNDLFNY